MSNKSVKPFVKFFRSFLNPISIKASLIVNSPLFSIIIFDNANIRVYSINGQFIKTIPCNAKYVGRFKDFDLNNIVFYIEDERAVCLSTPDLRNIS